MTEDETVGWHHRLNGHELEQVLGVGDGQGGLVFCSPPGCKELDTTEQLNWTELMPHALAGHLQHPCALLNLWFYLSRRWSSIIPILRGRAPQLHAISHEAGLVASFLPGLLEYMKTTGLCLEGFSCLVGRKISTYTDTWCFALCGGHRSRSELNKSCFVLQKSAWVQCIRILYVTPNCSKTMWHLQEVYGPQNPMTEKIVDLKSEKIGSNPLSLLTLDSDDPMADSF